MNYIVWIVSPPGYPHSPGAFMEVAVGLRDGLIELGHGAEIVTDHMAIPKESRPIILGANLLDKIPMASLPDTCIPIIYNLEQITLGSPWMTNGYIDLLKIHTVWDYCQSNIDELKKLGITASLMPVGYVPALTCIPDLTHEDWLNDQPLDVLFYGSYNERRMHIYNRLNNGSCSCHWAFGVYGAKRDALIARAKIVVNIHFYESKIHEIVRTSYLMANSKCIVSETGLDLPLEDKFYGSADFCAYENIAEHCMRLLKNEDSRKALAENGFKTFSQMKQSDYLEPLVGGIA